MKTFPVYVQTKDRVCSRKKPYPSEAAADSQIRQFHPGDFNIHAYECPYCDRWHIGHESSKASRMRAAAGKGRE